MPLSVHTVGGCSSRSIAWYWNILGQSVNVAILDGEIDAGSGARTTAEAYVADVTVTEPRSDRHGRGTRRANGEPP